jgi:hypothetical protein
MLTKTYKKLLNILITAFGSNSRSGYVEIKDTSNTIRYATGSTQYYPTGPSESLTTSYSTAGICVGSGDTPATEDDYILDSIITSEISGSVSHSFGADENDNPYIIYNVIINNTSSNEITINEIGMIQNVHCSYSKGTASGTYYKFLIDRTVLDEPVIIPAGSSKAIVYKFQANIYT